MKIGRNDPCPCGSGKKFKKCCIDKPEYKWKPPAATAVMESREFRRWAVPELAAMSELKMSAAELKRRFEDLTYWNVERVDCMDTDAIFRKLADVGVEMDAERFVQGAEGFQSAFDYAETWTAPGELDRFGRDADFPGVAACVLWKRLLPERFSFERLDDLLADGYERWEKEEEAEAARL